jgi:hypothetical protein
MRLFERFLIVSLLLALGACSDHPEDHAEAEILCEEENGALLADRCPGTTTCWKGDAGTGPWECVDQCTVDSCADGEICAGGSFEPPTCRAVPDCDLQADEADCTGG